MPVHVSPQGISQWFDQKSTERYVAINMAITAAFVLLTLAWAARSCASEPEFSIWPNMAPGEKGNIGKEEDLTKPDENKPGGKRLIRLGNVSNPTLKIFQAPNATGDTPCVMVCPGGGYHILALDLEGSEVCEWLNSIGVSAALLKYRVPAREGRERHEAALQDAQRAMGVLRSRAKEFHIDANKLGVLGFSAGGHLSTMLSAKGNDRTYEAVDSADKLPCLPNFTMLIYPAYLVDDKDNTKFSPGLSVSGKFPPTFMIMTQDDPVNSLNVVFMAGELTKVKVPVTLHFYDRGGHGYGLRRTEIDATTWPDRAGEWLRSMKLAPSK